MMALKTSLRIESDVLQGTLLTGAPTVQPVSSRIHTDDRGELNITARMKRA